jgi:hypothetical protein
VSFLATVLNISWARFSKRRVVTYVALLGAGETTGGTEASLTTTSTAGGALSGNVADTTAGLVVSLSEHRSDTLN